MSETRDNEIDSEMNACDQVMELAADYVDNELSAEKKALFQKHLESCPTCTAFITSYSHVVEMAHALGEQNTKPLDVGVQNRLRGALNRRLGISLPYVD